MAISSSDAHSRQHLQKTTAHTGSSSATAICNDRFGSVLSSRASSIPGIGVATAAVLVAKIIDIDRFETPEDLVGYFGIFPDESTSGVDPLGQPLSPGTQHLSRKGNDLVRMYLWNAAFSAMQSNPAVRALYRRLRAKGKGGDVALGHCMRKLLHLVFAVWKTAKPFDANHYPWEQARIPSEVGQPAANENAVGHKPEQVAAEKVVTTASAKVESPPRTVNASAPQSVPATERSRAARVTT
jgi:transposase